MRIAAYRPRIDAAFDELNEEASLRASFIVTEELVKRGHSEQLDGALRAIGWRLDEGRLLPNSTEVKELFFPKQSQHDAYFEIRAVLQASSKSITVVDPYVDQSVLKLLASALQAGINQRVVQERLGHTSVKMTLDVYSHLRTGIQDSAAEELHRLMRLTGDPVIGESLEETPEALRAAVRPLVQRTTSRRRPTAADDRFVKAINES